MWYSFAFIFGLCVELIHFRAIFEYNVKKDHVHHDIYIIVNFWQVSTYTDLNEPNISTYTSWYFGSAIALNDTYL